eukprot:IDg22741t1
MWEVSVEDATVIVEKLEEASLVRLEACGEDTGLRVHDLVLKLCQGMVRMRSGGGGMEDFVGRTGHGWVKVGRGGMWKTTVVCDVRWLWRRKHSGGWIGWETDSERLMNGMEREGGRGMKRVQWVVKRCWAGLGRSEFVFQVYGHLSKAERNERVHDVCWRA